MVTSITVLIVLVPIILLLRTGNQLSRSDKVQLGLQELYRAKKERISYIYTDARLKGLPMPVQRYFRYALREGQAYIKQLSIKHGGQFRTSAKQGWKNIRGEEYFTCSPPGFLWSGKLGWASAIDKYINGKGNLIVKIASLIPVVNAKGKAADQGEFLRWLAEAVWYPTALLPSENLSWHPIDEQSAKVLYHDEHIQVEGVFYFNELGQITHFKARRYMEDDRLEEWTTYCQDYREVNGMHIPFYAEAVWNLAEGDFSYARFELEEIEYEFDSK
ncbi:MAG: hypothetical protein F6K19_28865 [Cyanothece sp. SIO1E1]|nr:hypothetical protein [Cyanothece sp. SIO1E1]